MQTDLTQLKKENERLKMLLNYSDSQRLKEKFILQKFDLFTENTPMAVIEWDINTKVTHWNKAAEKIFGYSKKEALGQTAAELIVPKEVSPLIESIWKSLFKNAGGTRSTNENKTKDGKTILCDWYNIPYLNDEGEVIGISSMVLDITEKHKTELDLEESNNRYKMLSELTFEGIFIHKEGVVLDVNSSFERLTLFKYNEIIGKNIIDILVHEEYKKLVYNNVKNKFAGSYEVKGVRKDGQEHWFEIEVNNTTYKGEEIRAVALRDIQERKIAEQNLRKALQKAQESDRLKKAFLSTISHELRTPLNAVIGFSDLIDESMDIAEAAELAKMIFKSGNHLLEIINDIFELSMIEEGSLIIQKENVNLHLLLDEIHEHIAIEKRKLKKENLQLLFRNIDKSKDIQIDTDPKRLKQIFIHLLKNALKYTKEGSVEVGYEIIPDYFQFYVKDTGIGIPKEKQQQIFDLFLQLDDQHTREFEGVGIGLSIAHALCKNLGGEITVKSEPEIGSTFYFTIPHAYTPKSTKELNEEKAKDLSVLYGKKVLIAEDDSNCFEVLKMHLKPWNAKVYWAKNGVEAIDMFTKYPGIDIILMDIKMPVLSGYEATKEIRKISSSVPIIAQTAYSFINEKEIALQAGCDDYISKPLSWRVLSEKMAIHLKKVKNKLSTSEI